MKTPLGIAAAVLVLIWTANADARGGYRVSYGGGYHTTSHGGSEINPNSIVYLLKALISWSHEPKSK
jgi:hypothetical protein